MKDASAGGLEDSGGLVQPREGLTFPVAAGRLLDGGRLTSEAFRQDHPTLDDRTLVVIKALQDRTA